MPLLVARAASRPEKFGSAISWSMIAWLATQTLSAPSISMPLSDPSLAVMPIPPVSVTTWIELPA